MTESKEAIRERVRRFRELKKKIGVTVTDVTKEAKLLPSVTESLQDGLLTRIADLEKRVRELERQHSPEEVSRQQALKPGSRPNELYGA